MLIVYPKTKVDKNPPQPLNKILDPKSLTQLLYGKGLYTTPCRKNAITPKNNDPKEPKLHDFSYISMTNPPIPFGGSKWQKKGFL